MADFNAHNSARISQTGSDYAITRSNTNNNLINDCNITLLTENPRPYNSHLPPITGLHWNTVTTLISDHPTITIKTSVGLHGMISLRRRSWGLQENLLPSRPLVGEKDGVWCCKQQQNTTFPRATCVTVSNHSMMKLSSTHIRPRGTSSKTPALAWLSSGPQNLLIHNKPCRVGHKRLEQLYSTNVKHSGPTISHKTVQPVNVFGNLASIWK